MATIPSTAELQDQILHIDDNAVPDIIAVNVVCFTIACVSVILRFLARRIARVKYAVDDGLIVAGLVRLVLSFLPVKGSCFKKLRK